MYHSLRNSTSCCLAYSGSTLANGSMWNAKSHDAYCRVEAKKRGEEVEGSMGRIKE